MNPSCPLCGGNDITTIQKPSGYFACGGCALIFKDPSLRLNQPAELERYQLHNNSDTPEYRRHLEQLVAPLMAHLKSGAKGLDFGCGPVPLLSQMMIEQGYPTENFDPFFFNNRKVLEQKFDFILCCEVVEHFYSPREEFERLLSLLQPQGWLAIMTQAPPPPEEFAEWYYHRDPTHVVFFGDQAFEWMAQQWNLEWLSHPKGVSLLRSRDRSKVIE